MDVIYMFAVPMKWHWRAAQATIDSYPPARRLTISVRIRVTHARMAAGTVRLLVLTGHLGPASLDIHA